MPRFSIIVPAHGVEGRLPFALDSVLAQSFGDFELIPVCEASPSDDPRVVPVQSPPSAGLAGARNAGLRVAAGAYVLFLDGDDELAPGALAALDARLVETGDVDVLYFEHERVPWWVGEPTNPAAAVLAGPPRPAGVRLPAWSAAYRRAFLGERQLTFPDGHFTDVGFGGLVALRAERVGVARTVVVRHHARRQGDRLSMPGEHHFELLGQVDLVLTRAAEQGLAGEALGALFGALFVRVLRSALRVPSGRRAFFRRAGRLYRRHRPAGFRVPDGGLGVQFRLLATGSYTAFRVLRGASRLPGWMRAAARPRLARAVRAWRRRRGLYARALRRPLDENLAVFAAYWGRGYACNPAAIHAKARELAPHIRPVFLVQEKELAHMPADVDSVVIGTPRYWQVMARAKYTFNNVNFETAVRKRPGTVHVQTHHGTPLKRMGVDQVEYRAVAAATGNFGTLMRRVDRWDYSLSSNRHSTEVWSRAYPSPFEHLEYGYPRNDRYFTASSAEVAEIRARLGIPEDRIALLYAPTYRDYPRDLADQFDLAGFCAGLDPGFVVLLRAHYFLDGSPALKSAVEAGRLIDVTSLRETEDVCLASDALITDYSSIMFDYANLDRPIVIHADDWDVYRDTRGVYFDLMTEAPGHVSRTREELLRLFTDGSWADARAAELRGRFRERFCQFDDGHAAERVVRRVLLGQSEAELPPLIPLQERTPAPSVSRCLPGR
ncbi:CDP-glycerol glycerophosphotransferase family protein [Streptomyces sp. NPDC046909]|uniref:bifunctional glycosyltransferase/CDP-glycerol:glycerophosphate glycerophosphotransferase n=1 Tax=Streptomyces sp. NPDC046909 TaxID=3155617 RepID=UPI0033E733FC